MCTQLTACLFSNVRELKNSPSPSISISLDSDLLLDILGIFRYDYQGFCSGLFGFDFAVGWLLFWLLVVIRSDLLDKFLRCLQLASISNKTHPGWLFHWKSLYLKEYLRSVLETGLTTQLSKNISCIRYITTMALHATLNLFRATLICFQYTFNQFNIWSVIYARMTSLCALICPLFIYFIFSFIFSSFILSLTLNFKNRYYTSEILTQPQDTKKFRQK